MQRCFGKAALALFSAAALAATSTAETYYVSTVGDNAYDGLARVYDGTHGPKATIQAAIDVTSSGDTVTVLDGTYTGAGNKGVVMPTSRAITVQSENGPDNCIVDCENVSFGFRADNVVADFTIDGFTVRNVGYYYGYNGWGIRATTCPTGLVQNCVVEDANGYGIYVGGSDTVVRDCVVTNATLFGIHVSGYYYTFTDGHDFVVERCVISGCDSNGLYLGPNTPGLVTDCIITDNCTTYGFADGGGIHAESSAATIVNCVVEGNTASGDGGGVFVTKAYGLSYSVPTFINCTIINNSAVNGGGLYAKSGMTLTAQPVLANCILWGNTASTAGDQIALGSKGEIDVSYCDIEGGQNDVALIGPDETLTWGSGNINSDPLFVTGDYHLTGSSPCIDAGDNAAVPAGTAYDVDGDLRFMDDLSVADTGSGTAPIVDMGAHESDGTRTYYVSTVGNNAYDGLARVYDGTHGPKATIQAAIDVTSSGDTVTVLDGTYTGAGNKEVVMPTSRAITVQSENGPDNCIVDCENVSFGFKADYVVTGFTIDGFTVRNVGYYYGYNGWGIRATVCPTGLVQNCVVENANGYGIYVGGSDIVVRDCVVTNATLFGIHVTGYDYTPPGGPGFTIERCVISECDSNGLYIGPNSPGLITDCIITDNCTTYGFADGGGIHAESSVATIVNCVVEGNTATGDGGGVFVTKAYGFSYSVPTFVNCTIINNAAVNGGGLYAESGMTLTAQPVLANCILWDNTASTAGDQLALGSKGEFDVSYCDIEGGQNDVALIGPDETLTWGSGNINSDPLFVTGDYHLTGSSPCIDAGDNAAVPAGTTTDIDGDDRIDNDDVDMGADETT